MRAVAALSPRLIGLLTAAGAGLATWLAFAPPALPWNAPLHIRVEAGALGEINPGAWVEMNGARIGSVDRVESSNGHSVLALSIDHGLSGLHANARASIQPHGLLGPKFVSLYGGDSGTLRDGALIPLSRTSVSVDLDQVLNTLQPDVRQNLKVILTELGQAARGRGAQMNTAFQAAGSSSGDLSATGDVLRSRDDDLAALIVASEQLDRDLQYAPIDSNIADTDRMLSGLVQVDAQLGDGIDQTAAVMERLDVALDGNAGNLALVLSRAPSAADRLTTVAQEVDAILTGVNPALPSLMQAVMETKSAFQGRDGNGHFVRVQVVNSAGGPGSTVTGTPAQSNPSSMAPALSDRELIALFLGS
jgi:phospholipid/cholesterol/gamma-HCH transport system substrate-binding protein